MKHLPNSAERSHAHLRELHDRLGNESIAPSPRHPRLTWP